MICLHARYKIFTDNGYDDNTITSIEQGQNNTEIGYDDNGMLTYIKEGKMQYKAKKEIISLSFLYSA